MKISQPNFSITPEAQTFIDTHNAAWDQCDNLRAQLAAKRHELEAVPVEDRDKKFRTKADALNDAAAEVIHTELPLLEKLMEWPSIHAEHRAIAERAAIDHHAKLFKDICDGLAALGIPEFRPDDINGGPANPRAFIALYNSDLRKADALKKQFEERRPVYDPFKCNITVDSIEQAIAERKSKLERLYPVPSAA